MNCVIDQQEQCEPTPGLCCCEGNAGSGEKAIAKEEFYIEVQGESGEWHTMGTEPYGDDFAEALSCWFYEAAHLNSANVDLDEKTIDGKPFRVTTENAVVEWEMDEDEQAVRLCG